MSDSDSDSDSDSGSVQYLITEGDRRVLKWLLNHYRNHQAFWEREMDIDFFTKWLSGFTITHPEGGDIDITRHPELVKLLFNCRSCLFDKPRDGFPTIHSLRFLCRDKIDKLNTNKIFIKTNRETDSIITRVCARHRIDKFREELIRVTWHPDRFWDWCLDNSDKDLETITSL